MVRYITYEDKEYPIRVSYFALKKLKEELGRGLSVDDDGTDYEAYEKLLFFALQKGHQKMKLDFTFKKEDMEDVMDEVYFDFMKLIPEFFSDLKLDEIEAKSPGGKLTRKKLKN